MFSWWRARRKLSATFSENRRSNLDVSLSHCCIITRGSGANFACIKDESANVDDMASLCSAPESPLCSPFYSSAADSFVRNVNFTHVDRFPRLHTTSSPKLRPRRHIVFAEEDKKSAEASRVCSFFLCHRREVHEDVKSPFHLTACRCPTCVCSS